MQLDVDTSRKKFGEILKFWFCVNGLRSLRSSFTEQSTEDKCWMLVTSHFSLLITQRGEDICELQKEYQNIGEIPGKAEIMTLSAKVQQAKQRGADFYKSQNYSQSIEEYSFAIDNGDINDDELHLYYR